MYINERDSRTVLTKRSASLYFFFFFFFFFLVELASYDLQTGTIF